MSLNKNGKIVYRLVLTGGPCGGKTTGQDRLASFFESVGWKVYRVQETATFLLKGGVKFSELNEAQVFLFQKGLLRGLMAMEDTYFSISDYCDQNVLIICDRGTMDPAAYIDEEGWRKMLKELHVNEIEIRDNRYNQIVHLITAADGAEEFYSLENNVARSEGLDVARAIDQRTRESWIGHPYVDIVDNMDVDFEDKILRLIQVVCDRVGVHYGDRLAPDARKRKFLVRRVYEDRFPKYCEFSVWHDYLVVPRGEHQTTQVRIRKRGRGSNFNYSHTTRRFIAGQPVETRMQITLREYLTYRAFLDKTRGTTFKRRRCFTENSQYYQVDFYDEPLPSPMCKGLILLETFTTKKGDDLPLPDCLEIEREVTGDPAYSMYNMTLRKNSMLTLRASPAMNHTDRDDQLIMQTAEQNGFSI